MLHSLRILICVSLLSSMLTAVESSEPWLAGFSRVDVTPQELRLLEVFSRNLGRVLSRNQLIEAACRPGTAITDRAVDTHVFNLRKKIEPVPSEPKFLIGVRGLGYRFEN